MHKPLAVMGITLWLAALSGDLFAGAVARSTTGTSTETSTSSGTTASTGSCVGDSTAGKSTGGTGTTVTSGCTVEPPGMDDDGDGMTSTWEMTYGLDEYSELDKLLDLDADFISNYVEYLRGLTPNNDDTDDDLVPDGEDTDPANAGKGALGTDGAFQGFQLDDDVTLE